MSELRVGDVVLTAEELLTTARVLMAYAAIDPQTQEAHGLRKQAQKFKAAARALESADADATPAYEPEPRRVPPSPGRDCRRDCEHCKGTGTIVGPPDNCEWPCSNCNGTGRAAP